MPSPIQSGDPVPAVREADARGETADIFDDLRNTLGVPVVNLVWRHFATIPGALPYAWETVRPAYASGSVGREADRLRAFLPLPPMVRLTDPVWTSAGLDEAARSSIVHVLSTYNRSNAMNFLALSALVSHLDGADAGSADAGSSNTGSSNTRGAEGGHAGDGEPAATAPAAQQGALPHLLTLDEMAPATRELVLAFNELGERDDGRILASMYRHLAHWPGFLALAWALVAPMHADGRLETMIAAGVEEGRRRSRQLLPGLVPAGRRLDPQARVELRDAADMFVAHPIGKMLTICPLIRSATL